VVVAVAGIQVAAEAAGDLVDGPVAEFMTAGKRKVCSKTRMRVPERHPYRHVPAGITNRTTA
jgi:hypothetical protein